jgi:pyruvate dehydrogenase E2 component (dihydrolipoamide acetyltransferase)
MQEDGYIAKLLWPEGAKDVALGTPVAIIVDNKDDVAKFKDYTLADAGFGGSPKASAPKQET